MRAIMDLGPHAVFIWLSYAAVVLTLLVLIVWVWMDGRRQSNALAELQSRGIRRRSATEPE